MNSKNICPNYNGGKDRFDPLGTFDGHIFPRLDRRLRDGFSNTICTDRLM